MMPSATRPTRRLDHIESTALHLLAVGTTAFAAYGIATRSPNTVPYTLTVVALTAALMRWRRAPVPRPIAFGLAALAIAHLAGGLIAVGDDVLYNAHLGHPALEFDHLVHATGVALGVVVLWMNFTPRMSTVDEHRRALLLCLLGGLGLGALNETVEFVLTELHGGTHVGGYTNTGWDLVSNVVGALAAVAYVRTHVAER